MEVRGKIQVLTSHVRCIKCPTPNSEPRTKLEKMSKWQAFLLTLATMAVCFGILFLMAWQAGKL